MSWDRAKRGEGDVGPAAGARGGPGFGAVGKHTLTMDLPVAPPKAVAQDQGAVAADAVQRKTAGAPLASEVRSKVEPALSVDLSDVRVHDDPAAHSASAAISARAFAHGCDVFLGRGESPSDTRLVAHEVAHVVQQSGQRAVAPQAKLAVGAVDVPLEKEAAEVARPVPAAVRRVEDVGQGRPAGTNVCRRRWRGGAPGWQSVLPFRRRQVRGRH